MSTPSSPVGSDAAAASWHEIEDRLDEIARRARSNISVSEFYRMLLARIVPAAGVSGGAIWTDDGAGLRLEAQLNLAGEMQLPNQALLALHQAPVEELLRGAEPHSAVQAAAAPGADRETWLLLHRFEILPAAGAIELVARRPLTAAERRRCGQLLAALAELAEDFHRHAELRQWRDSAELWRQYEQFGRRAHESLDLEGTAATIANEARRIAACDRVSVLIRHAGTWRAIAVSGVDSIERRSKLVRALERLAARAAAGGDPLWYQEGAADIPDEIQRPLEAYLDESHARQLAVVPLLGPEAAPPAGVLVAERFAAGPSDLRERLTELARHAGLALAHAQTHSRMPLAWLGRLLSRARWLTEAGQLPKTAAVAALVAASAALLALVPADFDVPARGEFQPKLRREVFAADDGVVSELLVDHGQMVEAGQPLVVLRKPELELEFRRLAGERQTAEQRLASVEAERLENAQRREASPREPAQLAAEAAELRQRLAGLKAQQEILEAQQRDLTLRSPIAGQVLSWNLKQLLEARPLVRGQLLMTVGDLAGPWIVELDLADDRVGDVLAARDAIGPDLNVEFAASGEPGTTHAGQIAEVALSSELDEKLEPKVRAIVDFDKHAVLGLRPGATVHARVQCGRRSLGYVWLHDLFHYLQSLWW